MSDDTVTREEFPAGTTEAAVKAEAEAAEAAGASSATYTGSEAKGWVLTVTWPNLKPLGAG